MIEKELDKVLSSMELLKTAWGRIKYLKECGVYVRPERRFVTRHDKTVCVKGGAMPIVKTFNIYYYVMRLVELLEKYLLNIGMN